ncbi:MAG TPA: DUF2269 domain-containing protein [Gammaproteobacteria bacterium]
MDYLTLKWLHIVSATLLFGTGLGSAFYKYMTDRSGNLPAIAVTNRLVVRADWLFTAPSILLQPVTGVLLAHTLGHPLTSSWLVVSIALYILAGCCWLPVVYLQILMRDQSEYALAAQQGLDARYAHLASLWFWLGVTAFTALVIVYFLMIFKPALW